jgi:dihydrofolate synthase/folylpolyglutamate synthase
VIRRICQERNARLTQADFSALKEEFNSIDGQVFSYKGKTYALPLLGKNQLYNASVVLEAVDVLRRRGWKLDPDDVEHGLYSVSWPARFEIVSEDPFFVVDGGHNPQCAGTVVDNLLQYFPGYRRVILAGVMRDKDYPEISRILSAAADEFICVSPPGSSRALPAAELAAQFESAGKKATVCDTVREAVDAAIDAAGKSGMVCAVGSLYLAGAVRTCFDLL